MTIQDRGMRGYFQSDSGEFVFRFTRLKPGVATLDLSAPGYASESIPLKLKRGTNALDGPIGLTGLGIPDLNRFFIFEHAAVEGIACELRPVDSSGMAILNHPCMDLWIGCSVYTQLQDGVPALEESEDGSTRGRLLYRGRIPWTWDPAPETQFRYTALIPNIAVSWDASPYLIVDYLIVEPKPDAISGVELDELMARIYISDNPTILAETLDSEKDRLTWFMDTSYNVKAIPE
jgi:hypothetical protein